MSYKDKYIKYKNKYLILQSNIKYLKLFSEVDFSQKLHTLNKNNLVGGTVMSDDFILPIILSKSSDCKTIINMSNTSKEIRKTIINNFRSILLKYLTHLSIGEPAPDDPAPDEPLDEEKEEEEKYIWEQIGSPNYSPRFKGNHHQFIFTQHFWYEEFQNYISSYDNPPIRINPRISNNELFLHFKKPVIPCLPWVFKQLSKLSQSLKFLSLFK